MKLKAVDLVNLYLCLGTGMGIAGIIIDQYWWIIGGAAVFYIGIMSAEMESLNEPRCDDSRPYDR